MLLNRRGASNERELNKTGNVTAQLVAGEKFTFFVRTHDFESFKGHLKLTIDALSKGS